MPNGPWFVLWRPVPTPPRAGLRPAALVTPVPPGPSSPNLLAQIPARFRRGHPVHLAIRAAVIAGLCLTVLTVYPARPWTGFAVAVLIGVFVLSAREDMAPPDRPVRRLPPPGKT